VIILVTGARGAIGRAVVAEAKRRGHMVTGLGHGLWVNDSSLPLIDAWSSADVSFESLSNLAKTYGLPDAVVHLAGGSQVGPSLLRPAEEFRRTVLSSQDLLEWTRLEAPTARIILVSSAAVYGAGGIGRALSEDMPLTPQSPYGMHKATMEMLAASYGRHFGIASCTMRLFSVYGPGLRKQIVWDIAQRLLAGTRTIELSGSGDELRDFITVGDAANMLLDAIPMSSRHAPVFNGGSGVPTSIRALVELMTTFFPGSDFLFSGDSRPGDPHSLVADVTKARTVGLSASTPLCDGLACALDWAKGVRGSH